MNAETPSPYVSGPCYPELAAILVLGVLHVVTELGVSERAAALYNVVVSLAAAVYLGWRFKRTEGVLRLWGMRRDNFGAALQMQLSWAAVGALGLLIYGAAAGTPSLPGTFWLTLALYPIWGTAQQFALQNFIARNLAGLLRSRLAIAVAASALFGAAHYPRVDLALLAFAGGVMLTLVYRRVPNLWAAGIAHGILGTLAVYLVLGLDPGSAVLAWLLAR